MDGGVDRLFAPLPGGLAQAWALSSPTRKLQELRTAAQRAREALLATGPVLAVSTCKLVTFPYPTVFAFAGGGLSPAPYVMMTNRMQIVQFQHQGRRKTLLFNPSDLERDRAATFYAGLAEKYGPFLSRKVLPTHFGTVEAHLAQAGLSPEDIDFIAYDHLHVQDLRGWLGDGERPGWFPRAKLLVMRAEWESVQELHPLNAAWYVPGGCRVPAERVVLLEGDQLLGDGVALLSTPGHTQGNMSLAVVTPQGPFVVSENAVAAECLTPERSRIPGVRTWAQQLGYEVLLNSNTREGALDQFASMIVEKIVAGPCAQDGDFIAFAASSELTASAFAPLLAPTFTFQPPEVGALVPTR